MFKFKIVTILVFCALGISLFAQETTEPDLNQLEKEAEAQALEEYEVKIDEALQNSLCILEMETNHHLNPQVTSYSADSQILTGLYEGLFTYNPVTLEPQYAIAIGYQVSRDKKRITFTLRDDAYFSNGEKITAESVRKSWLKLLAEPDAPYSSLLDVIRGAESYRTGFGKAEDVGIYALEDNKLSLYLNTPANYLPRVLCHSAFSVVHDDPNVFSGPYQLGQEAPGTICLEKNPHYWDFAHTNIKYIVFVQSSDAVENTFLFNTGLASWIDSNFEVEHILDKDAVQMAAEFGTTYYFFKLSNKKPADKRKEFNPWDYEEFRNAVVEVMPWDKLRASAFVPATTFVYPLAGYPVVQGFDYTDEIEAKLKMKAAKEKYGIPEDQKLTLVFDISDGAGFEKVEEELKQSLAKIDVELVVRKIPFYEYIGNVKKSDADLFSYTWIGDFADPLAFLSLFQGNSTLNDSGWNNSEYDWLITQAAAASSDAERAELLAKAETILLDQGMVLPISHPVAFNVIDPKEIGGWSSNAFNIHPLKYLYKKATKSTIQNIVKK